MPKCRSKSRTGTNGKARIKLNRTGKKGEQMYQVEKGVPVPSGFKYPLREMEVGDSFSAPWKERVKIAVSGQKLKPKRFATRVLIENGKRVCRVWRIA